MKSFATLAVAISLSLGVASECDPGKYGVAITQCNFDLLPPNKKGVIDWLLSSVHSV